MRQQTEHATGLRFFRRFDLWERACTDLFGWIILAVFLFVTSAVVFAAIHFIASDDETARKMFNAEKFDWVQMQGKTVKNAVPSENGTRVTLGFTDGTHVELSSHKYALSVN